MKKHVDVLLGAAGSTYAAVGAWVHNVATAVLAYGPGVLTILYVGLKIYYKIKRERQRGGWRDDED